MRYVTRFLSLALAVLAVTGLAHGADGGMLKMRFTQSGNTSSSWPLYVAEQKKIFEKNGIQVEVIIIRGATNVVRAVLSETIPIGRINPDYVIGAAEKGARRPGFHHAEHELVMGVRGEALSRVAGTQELERFENAHPRHGCRFGRDRSGHRS